MVGSKGPSVSPGSLRRKGKGVGGRGRREGGTGGERRQGLSGGDLTPVVSSLFRVGNPGP